MPDYIVLHTIAKLVAQCHGLTGYRVTRERGFAISMAVLIAERGRYSSVVGMRATRCPRCGAMAEHRVTG
jgi:hypothetical protein